MGFEPKGCSDTHTSFAMPCPEHVTTLARLQHKTTEGTRTGRIKGTAEDQWKTQGKHRKGNVTNNIKGKPRGQTAEAAGQPLQGEKNK